MQQDTEIDEYANVMCNKTQEHKYLIRHMQQNIGMNECHIQQCRGTDRYT